MTMAYYHGDPGSYKTSSMVRDWLMPAIADKRRVLTNIRGIKPTEHIIVCGNDDILPAIFTQPSGTLILIDEIGAVYLVTKQRLGLKTESALETHIFDTHLTTKENKLNDDGQTIRVDQPVETLSALYQVHRHLNFDIVATAPSAKFIPSTYQAISEWGYKHRDLSSLGFKGLYMQGQHRGASNGTAASDFSSKKFRRMPKNVFALYESTTTGKAKSSAVKDAKIYKNPAVLFLVLIIVGVFANATFNSGTGSGILGNDPAGKPSTTAQVDNTLVHRNNLDNNSVPPASGVPVKPSAASTGAVRPYPQVDLIVIGRIQNHFVVATSDCQQQRIVELKKGEKKHGISRLSDDSLMYYDKPLNPPFFPCSRPVDPEPVDSPLPVGLG